jgi:hypothetical protein
MQSTLTRSTKPTAKKAATKPATGRCSLALSINGTRYKVKPLPRDFGGIKAFRLVKPDGEFHDVSRHLHGMECTCGDFVWRRDGLDSAGCKHVKAMKACGLLD